MYRNREIGNTIIRKEIRQHKIGSVRQQIFTYLVHINEEFLTIDTRFFTASRCSNCYTCLGLQTILKVTQFLSYPLSQLVQLRGSAEGDIDRTNDIAVVTA